VAKEDWLSVDDHVKELADESWSTYWREMGAEEALDFFKNPAKRLVDDGLIGDDFHVEFREVNAKQNFEAESPRCTLLTVFPDEKVAHITSYRHPE
jgi:hypothetical protein